MRIPLSRKIFILFFLLTSITIILGSTVFFEVEKLQSINDEILAVKDFQVETKKLEAFHYHTREVVSDSSKIVFVALIDNINDKTKKMRDFSSLNQKLINRLETVQTYVGSYKNAFFELAEKHATDKEIEEEIILLLNSLVKEKKPAKFPLNLQVDLAKISFNLLLLQKQIHHSVDIVNISKMKKIHQRAAQTFSAYPAIIKKLDLIVQGHEAHYLNRLAIKDRVNFLHDSSELFFEFAKDTASAIILESEKKLVVLLGTITTIILVAILLTFFLWYLASRYFANFLSNQEYAIESISTSKFDYTYQHQVPNDELGDLTIFMKALARSLKESKDLYKTLVENISLGITLINSDFEIVAVNNTQAKLLNKPAHELIGKKCFEEYVKRDEACEYCPGIKAMQSGRPEEIITNVIRDDGSRFTARFQAFPVSSDGEPTGFIEIVEDITERLSADEEKQHLEKQIQHTQKLESLGVLAGGIAHDFNNLLMAILGNADLALLEIPETSPAKRNILEIEKASRRAADLCNQMLAYSGKGKFMTHAINISTVVEEMTQMLEVSISKNVVLKYHFAENLPLINADASQLRQVIMNLIINASESIEGKSGVVSITTGAMDCDREYLNNTFIDEHLEEGLYVYVEVADTGCGMNEETIASLFDPFFTTKFTGRGLGMSAVLGIVRGHKGGIKVYSEVGQGTTFKMLFPAAQSTTTENGKVKQDKEDEWKGTGTILLVDDDETVRAVGKQMLERLGFTVLVAEDGLKGVGAFRQQPDDIDCVLLDLMMPHMNGDEAYREMRRIRPDVSAILSSGYSEKEVTQRFAGKGLAGFIQKPYTLAALREKLQKVFNNKDN